MTITIQGVSAPKLFRESLYKMRIYGDPEDSRNGPVRAIDQPVVINLWNPLKRVITDPVRNANPFFHVMEFVWMMSGSDEVDWIAEFNKNMMSFSDDGETFHAAYGHRWRKHFGLDQIETAISLLTHNPKDRRVVLNMWCPGYDLGHRGKDVPCNTQIYLRIVNHCLNMTVTNRSNDLIWGAMGANLVHMTFLQELIADAVRCAVGEYIVFTNNLHIYESVPNFEYYMSGVHEDRDIYNGEARKHVPLLQGNETYREFVNDAENFVAGKAGALKCEWMNTVALPIYHAWGSRAPQHLEWIKDDAWRIACTEWVGRKRAPVDNKLPDNNTCLVSGQQESIRVDSGFVQSAAVVDVGSCQPDVGTNSTESCSNGDVSP